MAAGKPVAYAGWGTLHDRLTPRLIPFAARPDLLSVLGSPEDLRRWLEAPLVPDPQMAVRRGEFIEETLGPIDGHASTRTLDVLRDLHRDWRSREAGRPQRRRLERYAAFRRPVEVAATAGLVTAFDLLAAVTRPFPGPLGRRLRRGCAFRRERAAERLLTARSAKRGRRGPA
jgi:hypothetical protein